MKFGRYVTVDDMTAVTYVTFLLTRQCTKIQSFVTCVVEMNSAWN